MKKFFKSNGILILNIISILLLLSLPVFLYYDFRGLHDEWKSHLDNGDIYMGHGKWLPTKPIIATESPTLSKQENEIIDKDIFKKTITYDIINHSLPNIQINTDEETGN